MNKNVYTMRNFAKDLAYIICTN